MGPLKGIGIGAGYFSAFHYDAWSRLSEKARIAAIFALDPAQAQDVAKRHGISEAHGMDALEAALDRLKPDFADLIVPPAAQARLVEMLARRGIAVMCQKPLGRDIDEARSIVSIAEKAGIRFMVHENWRWQPWYREMATLVGEGKPLGTLHSIAVMMRMGDGWPEDAYLARQPYFREYPRLLIFETGVHFLDTFRFLGGEIDSVYARLQRRNPAIRGEDAAQIVCGFANGATAILDASRYNESESVDPRYTFGTVRVDCAGGHVRLEDDGTLWVKQFGEPAVRHDYRPSADGFAGDCVHATIAHFVECLIDGYAFETDGRDYLSTLALVEACYMSADENRAIPIEQ